ncbi:DNA topoisomerase 3 [Magnetococcales bacterium HHB-1]
MILYLCEKPSQARDIGRVLGATGRQEGYLTGRGCCVTWCVGHLLEMNTPDQYTPQWKSWRLDTLPMIPEQWKMRVRRGGGKQLSVIKTLLKKAEQVVLATDADREGETIGREVLSRCRYQGRLSRLWLSALDDASIRKALSSLLPGEKTEPLYHAGLGRSRADWLVGMNLSRAYTILGRRGGYQGVLTVGRVQTPTLKLVVDRDRLIENFKPVTYFDLSALFLVEQGTFWAKWIPEKKIADEEGRCLDQSLAQQVESKIKDQTGVIEKAETRRVKEPPPLPLDLSTLQQLASRRFSMRAKQTLDIAQALYEKHKAITYPRTDCRFLPNNQRRDAAKILNNMGRIDPILMPLINKANVNQRSRAWNDQKITAHHAIIPTAGQLNKNALSNQEMHLYDLIRRYYLVQFFPHFEYDRTTIEVLVSQERFQTVGKVEKIRGWREVLSLSGKKAGDRSDTASDKKVEETQMLPRVAQGEPAQVKETKIEKKETKPPLRYTEGTLIQAMKNVGRLVEEPRFRKILRETSGIGTEATRASIIENLLKRQLLSKEGKKYLVSRPAGRALVDILPQSVTNPVTTAVWEQALEDIAQAGGTLDEFMDKSVFWINRLIHNVKVKEAKGEIFSQFAQIAVMEPEKKQQSTSTRRAKRSAPTPGAPTCPKCRSPMQQRKSKRGAFWGCSEYPKCRGTLPDKKSRHVREEAPQANNASNDKANHRHTATEGMTCPGCNEGTLQQRTAKKGRRKGGAFLGCSCFPKCRYTQAM